MTLSIDDTAERVPDNLRTRTSSAEIGPRADDKRESEEAHLSQYDKSLADSFPASDPATQP